MVDIEKQIEYWVKEADSASDTARILIKKKKRSTWVVFLPFKDK